MMATASSTEAAQASRSSGYRRKIAAFHNTNTTFAAHVFDSRNPRKCGSTRSEKPKIILAMNPKNAA
jgi:hypothetical protein